MKKALHTLFAVLAIGLCAVHAQDIHFSQYYASPLTLNPALTGLMDGNWRMGLNYRNQWSSVMTNPFVTFSGYADFAFMKGKLGDDWIGAGAIIVNDRAGAGSLSVMKTMLSGAYHKALGEGHFISAGAGGGWVQKRLDLSSLTFGNQITDYGFDPSLASGEPKNGNVSTGYPDMQAGLLWIYSMKSGTKIYAGGSLFHLFRPKDTFYGADARLGMRSVLHGGAEMVIMEQFILSPGLIYMNQNRAGEWVPGVSLGYDFMQDAKKRGILFAGVWYRLNDAMIATAGLEYESVRAGFSYDINLSGLNQASNSMGGPEISLKYEFPIPSKRKLGKVYCPRF